MLSLNSDFRDLLILNRRRYRSPLVPALLWNELGAEFDLTRWNKLLKAHRVSIVDVEKQNYTTTSAEFDSERSWSEITLHLSEYDGVGHIKFALIQTMMHEMIHASQLYLGERNYYRTISGSGDEEVDYLRFFGEIQAFAHCIAIEALHPAFNQGTAERYRDEPSRVKARLIRQVFRWVQRHESLNKSNDIRRWNQLVIDKLNYELGSISTEGIHAHVQTIPRRSC